MADRKTIEYTSVSDVENPHVKKYNVSGAQKPGLRISKLLCFLFVMGAILLAALTALAVYFLVPHIQQCNADTFPAAFMTSATDNAGKPGSKRKAAAKMIAGQRAREEFAANVDITLKRLPRSVMPTKYKLKLMPFLIENNFTTHGDISIDLDCIEATDKIVLHAHDIQIDRDSIRIKYVSGDYFFRLNDLTYDEDDEMFTFHLDRPMKTGEKYWLHMMFVSELNDLNQGFYRSSYTDKETNTERWIATSQFSPIDARRAFPCFDEPEFKATFTVSLARPNYMTTLSNMPRINTEDSMEMPGYSWDNFQETPKMSTYLLAFLVSDLQAYEHNKDGREFKIWSRKDVISQAIYSSEITPKILKYFENYFDIKFPLPKLDQVAVPDFGFSAMENWGLITYRENTLLMNEQEASIADQTYIVQTISHELTHQWFGNLVTPKFWNDLFLKEGFSNFFRFRGSDHVETSWNCSNELIIEDQLPAMSWDIYSFATPLSREIKTSDNIREAFDTITYHKGSSFVHMLFNIYGEENFRDATRYYLTKYQYSNANYNQFVEAFMERNSKIPGLTHMDDLKVVLSTWVQYPGFPVVTAVADYDNNVLTLSQKRFCYNALEEKTDTDMMWWIPVSYATQLNPDFDNTKPKMWIEGVKEAKIAMDLQDWYLLNMKNTGYYIVNYDERNWKKLANEFRNFPLLVRSQLLSNSMDLARANLLDYDIPLRLFSIVGRWDNHYIPYHIAFSKINYIYNMLLEREAFTQFNAFLNIIFDHAFTNTALDESATDTYEMRRLRPLILSWACKNSESRCVGQARSKFRALMINKTKISANLMKLIYCTAIREGGETEFNFAYEMYLNTTLPGEKTDILKSLGCTSEPWLLKRLLNMILDKSSGIRKQDGSLVFISVAHNIRGYTLAFNFIREHWKELKAYLGLGFGRLANMVQALSTYMNTPYHLEQLAEFGNSVELKTAKGAFKRVYEDVQLNVEWNKACYKSVKKWLCSHSQHFGY